MAQKGRIVAVFAQAKSDAYGYFLDTFTGLCRKTATGGVFSRFQERFCAKRANRLESSRINYNLLILLIKGK